MTEENPGSGYLETICQMPMRSKVMLAPADFLELTWRNHSKLLQYPTLRWWWLQLRSLFVSAFCKTMEWLLYWCVPVGSCGRSGTTADDVDYVLLPTQHSLMASRTSQCAVIVFLFLLVVEKERLDNVVLSCRFSTLTTAHQAACPCLQWRVGQRCHL